MIYFFKKRQYTDPTTLVSLTLTDHVYKSMSIKTLIYPWESNRITLTRTWRVHTSANLEVLEFFQNNGTSSISVNLVTNGRTEERTDRKTFANLIPP